MSIITILLPLALLLGLGFLAAFVWFAARGQYDDLETPAHRILVPENFVQKRGEEMNGNP